MTEFAACLDPECAAPAEVVDEHEIESTDGLVTHRATHCAAGHRFYGPVE